VVFQHNFQIDLIASCDEYYEKFSSLSVCGTCPFQGRMSRCMLRATEVRDAVRTELSGTITEPCTWNMESGEVCFKRDMRRARSLNHHSCEQEGVAAA
jgi:hypothetical protein